MKLSSMLKRYLKKFLLSPYGWSYTLKVFYFYFFPRKKNYCQIAKIPCENGKTNTKNSVKFVFAGDMMQLYYDQVPALCPALRELIGGADYFVTNCEAPIVDQPLDHTKKRYFNFSMPFDYLKGIIKQIPLEHEQCIINVANNHSCDVYATVFRKGVSLLRSIGLKVIGEYTPQQLPYTSILATSQFKIAVCAWTNLMNGERFVEDQQVVFRDYDIAELNWQALKKQQKIDFLIGVPHWDYEYQLYPCKQTRRFAKDILARGFDMLIGGHSHVVQPIEFIANKMCCYSMGNLCGTDWQWETLLLPVLEVSIGFDGKIRGYQIHFFAQLNEKKSVRLVPLADAPIKLQCKMRKMINLIYE
jgi:hypothetical protein